MEEIKEALSKVSVEPKMTGKRIIAENFDGIMELVNRGLSRTEVYRRLSERIDLGMSQRTFSTYLALEANKREN